MLIKKADDVRSSEITPQKLYLNRRKFLASTAMAGAAAAIGFGVREIIFPPSKAFAGNKISGIQKSSFSTTETVTPYNDVTHYNNYYEFGTEKTQPAELAKNFHAHPWKVKIDGQVEKKQELAVDDIIQMAPPEERIYRHRCVEGWSIVVPWVGFPLSELIKRVKPTGKANFVEFTTISRLAPCPASRLKCSRGPTSRACVWTRP